MVWCKSPNTHPGIREPALLHPIHQARRQQLRRLKNQTLISELHATDAPAAITPGFRDRCFPPLETLAMFVAQALDADHSCQKAVNDAAIRRIAQGLTPCSTSTGAYCRWDWWLVFPNGRGGASAGGIPHDWHWQGRPVRLVDGTFLSLPDTAANQALYPQSGNQKPGLGFPLCRMVGLFCLGSGSVLDVAIGTMKGKGGDERSLLRRLLPNLNRGDVLLGDALYGTYFLICELLARLSGGGGRGGLAHPHPAGTRSPVLAASLKRGPREEGGCRLRQGNPWTETASGAGGKVLIIRCFRGLLARKYWQFAPLSGKCA